MSETVYRHAASALQDVLIVGHNEFQFIFVHCICQQVSNISEHAKQREETKRSASGLFAVEVFLFHLIAWSRTHAMVFTQSRFPTFFCFLIVFIVWDSMFDVSHVITSLHLWRVVPGLVMRPLCWGLHKCWESWLRTHGTKYIECWFCIFLACVYLVFTMHYQCCQCIMDLQCQVLPVLDSFGHTAGPCWKWAVFSIFV